MKLRYETGIATFVQFAVLSLLGIANGFNSVFTSCRRGDGDCTSDVLTSIIFFILTAAWFGAIWILGYLAQNRRSKRLALFLIGAEAFIALIAYFNAKHYTDYLGLITSIVDLVLAIWIITLAFRLMRGGGKRITAKQHTRGRRTSK